MPEHVAIIMDGNGRWAKKRLMPRVAGHVRGVEAVRGTVAACIERGIPIPDAVRIQLGKLAAPGRGSELPDGALFVKSLQGRSRQSCNKAGVRLRIVGDLAAASTPNLQQAIAEAEALTAANDAL